MGFSRETGSKHPIAHCFIRPSRSVEFVYDWIVSYQKKVFVPILKKNPHCMESGDSLGGESLLNRLDVHCYFKAKTNVFIRWFFPLHSIYLVMPYLSYS